jgi:transposase, IS30 family
MGKKYEQLTLVKREKLYALSQQNFQVNTIADLLGCHRATIYRELNRNKTRIGYLPDKAHKMSLDRCSNGLKIDRNPELKDYIISKLQEGWSPEIITGCLKKERGISVISHETIYAYIYSKEGRRNDLYLSLKKRRKKRQAKMARKSKKTCIPNRISIHERPKNIGERDECGHWEGDLVLFSNSSANLITLRERKSRVFLAIKNPSKHADTTSKNIIKKFKGRKKILIETLTLDNGGEFARHEDIARALRIDTFFCDPYSSYQKGSVENGNGVLRYDLPRSADIDSLSQKQIDKIVDKINNRPMKCLGFRTPSEVFMENYGQLVSNW